MPTVQKFIDQLNRQVALHTYPPRRIISLVPSQTELLYDLGLDEQVVGITKFCIHPEVWYQTKKRVGGTKTVSLEKIAALAPDLILGNKEENSLEQIEALAAEYPVWMSDVHTLADALAMILQVGALTGTADRANTLARAIRLEFERNVADWPGSRPRVAYFIWRKPYMVAGGNTFIDQMLDVAGFDNVFHTMPRYPEIDPATLAAARPDCIFLSSEPFPFAEKHFNWFRTAYPEAQIHIVDGELFSWYGSRLLQAPRYFRQLRESIQ